MPKVDHGIGEGFEGVMQLTEALEAKQQAAKFVFPPKHPLNGIKSLIENSLVEEWLAASFGVLRARGFALILGTMPRLKMALRFIRQS